MKVRICSGNEKGAIKDLPQVEAENALATGFAELVDEKKDRPALDANVAGVPGEKTPAEKVEKPAKGKKAKTPAPKAAGRKRATARKK